MCDENNFPKPKYITGGCLCGSLRYRVDFSDSHNFLKSSGTCQCTMDRKCCSALWLQYHQIQNPSVFKLTSPDTSLKHYESSPGTHRGFCGGCGSFLFIKPAVDNYDRVTIAIGTVDAIFLFGEGADGKEVPNGGFGFALTNGGGNHEWCQNEIRGVTEGLKLLGYERGIRWDRDPN